MDDLDQQLALEGVKGRDLVNALVHGDFKQAYEVAKRIRHPWYRCQSLARVARFAPDSLFDAIWEEALAACLEASASSDPYKAVAVSAWPIRTLIERNRLQRLSDVLSRMLNLSSQIQHPVSRLEALTILYRSVFPAGSAVSQQVFDALRTACEAANSWKAGSRLAFAALLLAKDNVEEARHVVDAMPDSRYKRRALEALDKGIYAEAREFF